MLAIMSVIVILKHGLLSSKRRSMVLLSTVYMVLNGCFLSYVHLFRG